MIAITPKEIPEESGYSVTLVIEPETPNERALASVMREKPEFRDKQLWRTVLGYAIQDVPPTLLQSLESLTNYPHLWAELIRAAAKTS